MLQGVGAFNKLLFSNAAMVDLCSGLMHLWMNIGEFLNHISSDIPTNLDFLQKNVIAFKMR